MEHTHGPNGEVIFAEPAAAEPAAAETEAVEAAAEAEVEVAKVQAQRDIAIEKEFTKRAESEDRAEIEALRGEVRGLRELVETLKPAEPEPAPQPVPVVVEAPPEPETAPAPEPVEESAPPAAEKKSSGFWGPAYR